jgi:hypothetical protein
MNNQNEDKPRNREADLERAIWGSSSRNPELGSDLLKVGGIVAVGLVLLIAAPALLVLISLLMIPVAIYQGIKNNS